MKIEIDISQNILTQFANQLQVAIEGSTLITPTQVGKGSMEMITFPGGIELYHVDFHLQKTVEIQSFNPSDSNWLLLNINLSKVAIQKTVNDHEMRFQKFLPSGILFYTPNTRVYSKSPAFQDYKIVLIRLPRIFFEQYQATFLKHLQTSQNAILYEDLNYTMEKALMDTVQFKESRIRSHSYLMQFLADLADKLERRDAEGDFEQLHPNDIKGLFMACAFLRDPLAQKIPSIAELAEIAGMGTTKFKTTFKQIFGKAPIQYHQHIRFNYAREELKNKRKSPSELSYELGYSHPSKFTSAYKKVFGEVPSAFN